MKRPLTGAPAGKYVSCGRCSSGFIVVYCRGERYVVRCGCWLRWKAGQDAPVVDGKLCAAEGRP